MKVVHAADVTPERSPSPIFEGEVSRQGVVNDANAEHLRLAFIHFSPGARTKLHTHTFEQVLVIWEGKGILATEQEEHAVTPGDMIIVPPGERHWHGAAPDSPMTHISVTTPGETRIEE